MDKKETKIPWGPFHALEVLNNDDDPWLKLKTIAEYLEDGEPVPHHLSYWLGNAILKSKENPDEFMRLLELKKKRGAQKKFSEKEILRFCEALDDLEREGLS